MINSIKQFFEKNLNPESEETLVGSGKLSKIDLVCAALLIEVMNCDHQLDERESEEFIKVLQEQFQLEEADLEEICNLAKEEARQATSLYEFTRLINDHYQYDQKLGLIENMWRVAFSDEELDKYEDHLIRRVSELIYVSHSDFIRSKLKIRNQQ